MTTRHDEAQPGQAGPGLPTDMARQGETTGRVRWVLGVSVVLAILAMILAFEFF